MRHVYTRTIIGVIWLIVGVAGLFTAEFLMACMGLIAGVVYLSSANNMRKKEKENK